MVPLQSLLFFMLINCFSNSPAQETSRSLLAPHSCACSHTCARLDNTSCVDDFGVQPFDTQSRALLLDIIEDRHGKSSAIINAQVPVKKWHEVIGEKALADAIMDRIVHQSIAIELYGE